MQMSNSVGGYYAKCSTLPRAHCIATAPSVRVLGLCVSIALQRNICMGGRAHRDCTPDLVINYANYRFDIVFTVLTRVKPVRWVIYARAAISRWWIDAN